MQEDVLVAGHPGVDLAGTASDRDDVQARRQPDGNHPGFSRWNDVLGVAWVLASGLAIVAPVLINGKILGPFDLLSQMGLTKQPGTQVHIAQNSDLINSLIPWGNTVWQQVHQGHLPLWNPYGGLGMPLAFNWQSAPLGLPALVGYLFPLRYAFTAGVIVSIVVAGSGAYVLGRVLGMGALASAAVGTVFELSGPFAAWLGYPFPAALCWAGWIFAVSLLLVRRRHRAGYICALALCVAASLNGGAPEGFTSLMIMFAVFFAVYFLCRTRWLGGSGPIRWPAIDLAVGTLAGIGLAAPFALPGFQVVSDSVRNGPVTTSLLRLHTLTYLAIPAFDGLPIFHHGKVVVFGVTFYYTESAMYVGVCALVLAAIGIVSRWRRAEVRGFAVVSIICLVIPFNTAVNRLAGKLPLVGHTDWVRLLMPMALAVAVLAGYGIDLVVRSPATRQVGRRLGIGFVLAAAVLAWLWIFGHEQLGPAATAVRAHSFIWPAVETGFGLAAAAFLLLAGWWLVHDRPDDDHGSPRGANSLRRWSGVIAGGVLLGAQTAFLVSSGATMIQSSPHSFPQTAAARALVGSVGTSTVAFAEPLCGLGIDPNINDAYGVHELEVYDPVIPADYFSAWRTNVGTDVGNSGLNLFCPVVKSASVAREFGVAYVLTSSGAPAPTGGVYVRHLGDEVLYHIPGSGEATTAPLSHGDPPPDDVAGTPVAVSHQSPSQWHVTTSATTPQVVRFHLTNTPGWTATIDGHPLALQPYVGMMLQARIPAGHHSIDLSYWPKTLTAGILVASASLLFLIGLLVASSLRRRRADGTDRDRASMHSSTN